MYYSIRIKLELNNYMIVILFLDLLSKSQEYLGVGTTPAGSISVYKLAGKGAPVEGYLDTRTR